jgi:phosphoribosylformylglycinamidine synthase subunit PurS
VVNFAVRVQVKFKEGILDPQSEAIRQALESLEFSNIQKVECEKSFVIHLKASDKNEAISQGRKMAQELLANLVMENFEVELVT